MLIVALLRVSTFSNASAKPPMFSASSHSRTLCGGAVRDCKGTLPADILVHEFTGAVSSGASHNGHD